MTPAHYLIVSSISLSVFYLFYLLVFRQNVQFKFARLYLLSAIIISILLPFNTYKIEYSFFSNTDTTLQHAPDGVVLTSIPLVMNNGDIVLTSDEPGLFDKMKTNWRSIIFALYLTIAALLFIRFVVQIILILHQYRKSPKEKRKHYTLVYCSKFNSPFSFFHLIFIKPGLDEEEKSKILVHEHFHVLQYHSVDIMLIEILSVIMWFNPIIWMMKKSVQLIHEYLADEGALGTGIDKLQYQALLINQLTGERLISISSGLNHSLLKQRMIMMTKNKVNHQSKLKILALIPVAALLFLCSSGANAIMYPDTPEIHQDTLKVSAKADKKKKEKKEKTKEREKEEAQVVDKQEEAYRIDTVERNGKLVPVIYIPDHKEEQVPNRNIELEVYKQLDDDELETVVIARKQDDRKLSFTVDTPLHIVSTPNVSDSTKTIKITLTDSVTYLSDENTQENKVEIRSVNNDLKASLLIYIDGEDTVFGTASSMIIKNPIEVQQIEVLKEAEAIQKLKGKMDETKLKEYNSIIIVTTKEEKEDKKEKEEK